VPHPWRSFIATWVGSTRTSTPTHNTPENPMATLLFTLLPFAVTFTAAAFSPAEPTLPTDRPTPLRSAPCHAC